uniref:Uncharacterized protein C3orf67 homolog n=1 Tax=Saccoglossus kowalevskii TaxID=10224 RepID=A0ABM0MLW2_SACKO|nr:PREDICTED: uncharacterized protein C3orf67 homolog [Saccoglossus kowalevskii]
MEVYDKDVKSYVFVVEGEGTTTKMQLPKDNKQSLLLIQRYLILQLMVPLGHDFSIELSISDMGNNKRRLFLSSSQKEISITPLHAKIPLSIPVLSRGMVLTMQKIRLAEMKLRGELVGTRPVSTLDLDLGASQKVKNNDVPMHIAFGSKVPVPSVSAKKPSIASRDATGNRTSRSVYSRIQRPDDAESNIPADPETNDDMFEQSELVSGRGVAMENPTLKPHPPREKSSERSRRVVRVRNVKDTDNKHGDDDTVSHRIGSGDKQRQIRDESKLSKTVEESSQRIGSGEMRKRHNHVQYADSVHIVDDSGHQYSENASGVDNVHLNGDTSEGFSQEEDSQIKINVENSDISRDDSSDLIYTFTSPPRSTPMRKDKLFTGVNHKAILTSMKNEVELLRESQQALMVSRGARPEEDFYADEDDEITDVIRKLQRRTPSPRSQQRTPSPNGQLLQVPNKHSTPDEPTTPGTSQSRLSISSKRVREIPKDDARLSAVSPTRVSSEYDWRKYASPDNSLSSSFEASMLASLKRQQLEEMDEEDDEDFDKPRYDLDRHNYGGDDDLSSSSDDTSFNTWRGPVCTLLYCTCMLDTNIHAGNIMI